MEIITEILIVINSLLSLFISYVYLFKYKKLKKAYILSDEKFYKNKKVLLVVYPCSMLIFLLLSLINIIVYPIIPNESKLLSIVCVILFYVLTFFVTNYTECEYKGNINLNVRLVMNAILLFVFFISSIIVFFMISN